MTQLSLAAEPRLPQRLVSPHHSLPSPAAGYESPSTTGHAPAGAPAPDGPFSSTQPTTDHGCGIKVGGVDIKYANNLIMSFLAQNERSACSTHWPWTQLI
ncbi:hypothetical protein E2C01_094487 [Portunus trituberculatus]|uniref:Uncharacterized protein n=1 Tax=Portunus trituberculatus TaxID=210409 RepID=A0A5B7JM92_PORTR|nr:hypothetical protein [Portunus trituberculatus]